MPAGGREPACALTLKGDARIGAATALVQRVELESPLACATLESALVDGLDLAPWLARFRTGIGSGSTASEPARFLDALERLCGPERLRRRAGFTNLRETRRVRLADGSGALELELLLDETRFPGGRIDYEIELELAPGDPPVERIEGAVSRWLAEQGISGVTPASSKLARLESC